MKPLIAFAAVLIVTIAGCNNRSEELEKQNSNLQAQNNQLTQDIAARDEYVDNITQSINDVTASLENVRSHEGMVLRETNEMEAKKKLTSQEVRQKLMAQVSLIDSSLKENHRRIADLQAKLNSAKTQYAGLKRMVTNLQHTVAARESTITQLEQRILGLEAEVGTKTRMLAERDSTIQEQHHVIGSQHSEINRAYYIIGKRRDLESKGVITSEGGFLWGLLGSSTVLASGFDTKLFTAVDKFENTVIDISGTIDELIPKRREQYYSATEVSRDKTTLTIAEPQAFWQDRYLVIITD